MCCYAPTTKFGSFQEMENWIFSKKLTHQASRTLLLLAVLSHLLQFQLSQHTKKLIIRFYSQFLDSAPSVSALGGSRGPRRYHGWPQNVGHCPRIGYRTSFLNFYYANLAKTMKKRQNSQKQDDKKTFFKPQKPPKWGSLMVILHKFSKKCPKPKIWDFGYICMRTHCAMWG